MDIEHNLTLKPLQLHISKVLCIHPLPLLSEIDFNQSKLGMQEFKLEYKINSSELQGKTEGWECLFLTESAFCTQFVGVSSLVCLESCTAAMVGEMSRAVAMADWCAQVL